MDLETLQTLYRHMEWADASVWRAVLACDSARGDEKLRALFYHLHLVQHAFLRVWRGEPPDAPYPNFDEVNLLMSWGKEYYSQISAQFEMVTEEDLSSPMQIPWSGIVTRELGRSPAALNIGQTILQVPLHSQYHRGQINARLREVGGEPPRVDYIVWMWLAQPIAEWPV